MTTPLTPTQAWSDMPIGSCPVVAAYCRVAWDSFGPPIFPALTERRARIAGSRATRKVEIVRAYLAADRAVRVFAPGALVAAGLTAEAATLRGLAPIRSAADAAHAADVARATGAAAGATARAADATHYAAGATARAAMAAFFATHVARAARGARATGPAGAAEAAHAAVYYAAVYNAAGAGSSDVAATAVRDEAIALLDDMLAIGAAT